MSFDAYSTSASDNSNKPKVDFDALNQYVVDTCELQDRTTLAGYVSAIVDLGTQAQPDSEVTFVGTSSQEAEEIAAKPQTYFKDGLDPVTRKPVRLKCWPNKPIQSVAVAVDFPDIMLDKGKFFGNSNPQPLRMWLGDTFYVEGTGMVVARVTPLKVNKKLGNWSFDQKHLFYKMAVACKLIKTGECFLPNDIDKLLGKAFQFDAQVFFRDGKDGKKYFTEKVKFSTGLGRGQQEPEMKTEPFLIQFNKQNDPDKLKEVRNHVLNTIKRAENYQGSAIQKQIEAQASQQGGTTTPTPNTEQKPAVVKPKVVKPASTEIDDSDVPF